MSVTSNPTPDGEQIPDTSGLPNLSGVDAEASSLEGFPERDVMAPWGEAGPPGLQWRADILGEGYESRTPGGKLATMADIVGATMFLLDNRGVSGTSLYVDRGWRLT